MISKVLIPIWRKNIFTANFVDKGKTFQVLEHTTSQKFKALCVQNENL